MAKQDTLSVLLDEVQKRTAASIRVDYEQEPVIERKGKKFPIHAGQRVVWRSMARVIAAIAGTRSGKTCLGPWWILRELQRRGGGDALIVGPTYPLMDRRLVPECQNLWQFTWEMGEYKAGRRCFEFNEKGLAMLGVKQAKVWFAFAEDPESLESMEAVCIWRDESGQSKFSREAKEALARRVSMDEGRILDTTTPYEHNWFKFDIFDKAAKWTFFDDSGAHEEIRERGDPLLEVVSYRSIDNPEFPFEEWERQEREMAKWKFEMMYCGLFTRPAGAVYEKFDFRVGPGGPGVKPETNVCEQFIIPNDWKRVAGHDFGPVHTAGVWAAQDPKTKVWYGYNDYLDGNKDNEEHIACWEKTERAWGGSWSEDSWRTDYALKGYRIQRPVIRDLHEGIDRLHSLIASRQLVLFSNLASVSDFREYAWQLGSDNEIFYNAQGKPVIASKESFHRPDAWRYLGIALYAGLDRDVETRDAYWFGSDQRTPDGEPDESDLWCPKSEYTKHGQTIHTSVSS